MDEQVETIFRVLREQSLDVHGGDAIEAAIGRLTALRGESVAESIRAGLRDRHQDVRYAAADALGGRGDRGAVEDLLPLLHDPFMVPLDNDHRVAFPVRASALDSLQRLGWSPVTEHDRLLVRNIEGDGIDHHDAVFYFLGAGFAHCHGLPLTAGLGTRLLGAAWNRANGSLRGFLERYLHVRGEGMAAELTLERVFDAIYAAGDETTARLALRELEASIRLELGASAKAGWKPDSRALDRFFRFITRNGHHNFIVTTNWDTFLDAALQSYLRDIPERQGAAGRSMRSFHANGLRYVDYGLYPALDRYQLLEQYCPVHLYKINGSVDWLWCAECCSIYGSFLPWERFNAAEHQRCPHCGGSFDSVLVMPSANRPRNLFSSAQVGRHDAIRLGRSRMNPEFEPAAVFDSIATSMAEATLWVFMGYSLPEYDGDTIRLLETMAGHRREAAAGLANAAWPFPAWPDHSPTRTAVTAHVIGWEPDLTTNAASPTFRRYEQVLRREFRYFPYGIEQWIEEHVPDRP